MMAPRENPVTEASIDIGSRKCGLKAVIDSKVISHERLPMLEVVCDRMVRAFAASMRNLTSDVIDINLDELTSVRFGNFMHRADNSSMIGVFNIQPWDNYGVLIVEPPLIYTVVDALLGGRTKGRSTTEVRAEGRGYTAIETSLIAKMINLALADLATAFEPIAPITIVLDRVETNPRFAAIASPTNIAVAATFRVDMEGGADTGRGGRFTMLLPYATLEPVHDKLLQRFMGEKLKPGNLWQAHMAAELHKTEVSIDVVLGSKMIPLGKVRAFAVGQTITLYKGRDEPLELQCGGISLGYAQIGQRRDNIAVRMVSDISKGQAL